jgi:NADP-dependent 3-hydroxy acid dehydrogenase YdfG
MRKLTVLITGASAGFGLEITRRFAASGHRVIAAARRIEKLHAIAGEFPGMIHPIALDVRTRAAVEQAIASLPENFSQVDVLVNNAGLALGLDTADRASLEDWETMIATNCTGLSYVTRTLLPRMVARGSGLIVNMGSIAAEFPYPGGNVYGATKAFVHQFTQNLNADLIGTGVRATCIEPGLCGGTEFSSVRFNGDAERATSIYAGTMPLTPSDIADTVEWVASRPAHVNINLISMMPTCQSFASLAVKRIP